MGNVSVGKSQLAIVEVLVGLQSANTWSNRFDSYRRRSNSRDGLGSCLLVQGLHSSLDKFLCTVWLEELKKTVKTLCLTVANVPTQDRG